MHGAGLGTCACVCMSGGDNLLLHLILPWCGWCQLDVHPTSQIPHPFSKNNICHVLHWAVTGASISTESAPFPPLPQGTLWMRRSGRQVSQSPTALSLLPCCTCWKFCSHECSYTGNTCFLLMAQGNKTKEKVFSKPGQSWLGWCLRFPWETLCPALLLRGNIITGRAGASTSLLLPLCFFLLGGPGQSPRFLPPPLLTSTISQPLSVLLWGMVLTVAPSRGCQCHSNFQAEGVSWEQHPARLAGLALVLDLLLSTWQGKSTPELM